MMRQFKRGGALLASLGLMACGGVTVVPTGGAGGAGGADASSSTDATSTNVTSSESSSAVSSTVTGTPAECAGLGQIACLEAYPSCAPIYDDVCCPSCTDGPCADCVDWRYFACTSRDAGCLSFDPPVCGVVPGWACVGTQAECPADPGGSPTPCGTVPGCVLADCPNDVDCDLGAHCVPVHAGMCTTLCDSIPPDCPDGTTAESDGFCYTGLCIPMDVCSQGG